MLIVDDQALFRDAARAAVRATPGFEPVAEAASGEEALAVTRRLRPDLVLLDMSLPGIDGLETSRRLTAGPRAQLVVLMSADDDPVLSESAGACGAVAFLSKQHLCPRTLRGLWERHHGAVAVFTPPG